MTTGGSSDRPALVPQGIKMSDIDRRKTDHVVWMAFQWAKQDRRSLIDVYDDDDPMIKEIEADIRALERIQKKIFGTTRSRLDAELSKMKMVSIQTLMQKMRT